MGFSYFHSIGILSVKNILAPYKLNKYYNFCFLKVCSSDMLFIRLRECVNDILLYELCIWTEFFSFLSRMCMVRSRHRPMVFRSGTLSNVYCGHFGWVTNDHGLDVFFACLIRIYAKSYLLFSGIRCMEALLLQFACMHGQHGRYKKLYIYYYSKSCQWKDGRERFISYDAVLRPQLFRIDLSKY